MAVPLMSGTSLIEALEGSALQLMPSNQGGDSSLSFRQIQAGLAGAGFDVSAPPPQGTTGAFNARTAAVPVPVPVAESVPQEPHLAASQKMTLSNG